MPFTLSFKETFGKALHNSFMGLPFDLNSSKTSLQRVSSASLTQLFCFQTTWYSVFPSFCNKEYRFLYLTILVFSQVKNAIENIFWQHLIID